MTVHDVVVVGDGPAGAALAASCAELGLDAVVVGPGEPWHHTYATWLDDVPGLPPHVFAGRCDGIEVVAGGTVRRVGRAYGVLDNAALRAHLQLDGRLHRGVMAAIHDRPSVAEVELADGDAITGRVAVDATGRTGDEPAAWQTAYGVVVDATALVGRYPTDAVTLMDWDATGPFPTFCYVVPVAGGWLVEETVLAASPAVEPSALRSRLVSRLDTDVVVDAEAAGRVEQVRIPMGAPMRRGAGRIARFGAAAGMIHPATGYSVAASLRAAPRVAQAVAAGADVHETIWPRAARRTRALHDHGLRALLGMEPDDVVRFFDRFFELPAERWAAYLRSDTTPGELARVMWAVFRAVPWSVRRELVGVGPGTVHRLVRP